MEFPGRRMAAFMFACNGNRTNGTLQNVERMCVERLVMHLCCNGAGGNLFHSFSLVCCFVSYIACLPACMFHSPTDLEPNMHTHTPRNHREHLSRCMMNAVGLLHRAFCAENHDFQLLLPGGGRDMCLQSALIYTSPKARRSGSLQSMQARSRTQVLKQNRLALRLTNCYRFMIFFFLLH